jgi:hypothetical protein
VPLPVKYKKVTGIEDVRRLPGGYVSRENFPRARGTIIKQDGNFPRPSRITIIVLRSSQNPDHRYFPPEFRSGGSLAYRGFQGSKLPVIFSFENPRSEREMPAESIIMPN